MTGRVIAAIHFDGDVDEFFVDRDGIAEEVGRHVMICDDRNNACERAFADLPDVAAR